MWAILSIALLIRWVAYYYYNFIYQTPSAMILSPISDEATTYENLARQILYGNGLSQELFANRPPLQPMFIALVYQITGTTNPLIAAFAQTFVSAGISLLGYRIAGEMGASVRVQQLAGLIVAIDPASIIVGLTLMAETLSNFFLAVSLLFSVRLLNDHRARDAAAAAAGLALATLARPNSIYFFGFMAIPIICLVPRWPKRLLLYLSIFAIGVLPWHLRNHIYNNLFTFSTVGNFNLLFYKGVAVEHWATGEKPTDIEERLAYEVDLRLGTAEPRETYDYSSKWKFFVTNDPEKNRVITEIAIEIYRAHPLTYILVTPLHLVKLLAFTNLLASAGNVKWLELAFNILFYSLAMLGCVLFWKKRVWTGLSVAAVPSLYFLAVPLITGGIQDTRARTTISICLAIMAAEGAVWLWERRQQPRLI